MTVRRAVARLGARPRLLLAGGTVAVVEVLGTLGALFGLAGLLPEWGTLVRLLVVVGATVAVPVLLRPAPLAVLYAATRTDGFGLRDIPGTVRAGYGRLLAGGVAAHGVALALLPVALLVAVPATVGMFTVLGATPGQPNIVAARPVERSTVRSLAVIAMVVGYAVAHLPLAVSDLLSLDGHSPVRAPLDALGALRAAPRAGGRYLLARGGLSLVASSAIITGLALTGGIGYTEVPPAGVVAGVVLLGFLVTVCRTLVGILHVETFEHSVAPVVASSDRAAAGRRWLTRLAVAGVLVVGPVVAAGATAYDSEVETAYDPPEAPSTPTTPYAYDGQITVEYPNGTEKVWYRLREETTEDRSLVRERWRNDGYDLRFVSVIDEPFAYRIRTTDDDAVFEGWLSSDSPDSWQSGVNATRTLYVQEWASTSPFFEPTRVPSSFAYRRVGRTTYRGIPAVEYAAKSWLVPRSRSTPYYPATGRLVVARESGAVLHLDVTRQIDDHAHHYEYTFQRLDRWNETEASRIVERVRRNVTVDSPLYPTRRATAPGVEAFQSGRIVGASFTVEDRGVTIPAGATVTAVGANGTNVTTTLSEPVTPTPGGRSIEFDLVFELGDDGRLERRDPGDLASEPVSDAPEVERLVIRDQEQTYVAANVVRVSLRDVTLDQRTAGDHQYVALSTEPANAGVFLLEVANATTGEVVYDDRLQFRERAYLTWLDDDILAVLLRPPSDDIVADRNGRTTRRYVVRVYGLRGLVAEQTVTLTRPRPVTPTPGE